MLALKKYDAPDFIIFLLEKIISCDYFDWALELLPGDQTGEEKLLKKSDFYMWNKQPEIPVEEPKKISVASFCDCGSKCKMLATVSEGCLLSIEPDTDGTPPSLFRMSQGKSLRSYLPDVKETEVSYGTHSRPRRGKVQKNILGRCRF